MSAIRSALIIGGGIAGPVAGTALQMAGIEGRVYEAYPGPAYTIGSTLGFAPNGLSALDVIGAGDAVRAVAMPMPHTIMAMGGNRNVHLPALPHAEPLQVVERSALHTALHDHAVAAGVPFEYGKRLIGVDEHADGITARFEDGSTATADVLIGADGVKSLVRKLIDPDAPDAGYTGMLGFAAWSHCSMTFEPGTMVFAYGKKAYYIVQPAPDGRVNWGANLPHEYMTAARARELGPEHWLGIMDEIYGEDDPGAELVRNTRPEDLQIVGPLHIMPPVPHWYRDRMVLVGDAVHCPSNSTGQGASLAIESAIQLARCLRDFDDAGTAFAAYERIRRPRVERITARGAKINHTKTMGPVMRRTLPVLMPMAFRFANLEKMLGREQRYTIDWDAPVNERAELAVA